MIEPAVGSIRVGADLVRIVRGDSGLECSRAAESDSLVGSGRVHQLIEGAA